jgi:glycosyltransferase involved in cell wall biosynthesis
MKTSWCPKLKSLSAPSLDNEQAPVSAMRRRLLFVVNVDWFFLSHRLPVALAAMREGYEVHVATGITDRLAELESYGLTVHPLRIRRGRAGILAEWGAFFEIFQLFRAINPDLVHLVTIKPVLYGGIAARLAGTRAVVAAISGLGFVLVDRGIRARLRRLVVGGLYRLALGKTALKVIFQNANDRDYLVQLARLPSSKYAIIPGSGVDLTQFAPTPLPPGIPVIVLACRLISDKGVWEFVDAARLLRQRSVACRLCLVGAIDTDNPASLNNADLARIRAEGIVELWGQRSDMAHVIHQAHVVALPSYYGEGLPKVLIEAAACGRAIVTTDMPGCRDAILPGQSGALVPARDAVALANAFHLLITDPVRCAEMGRVGRAHAEREFDLSRVVATHLDLYLALLSERR